jgi:hypothetical protein
MIYLLDTNVWVQFLRNRDALVVQCYHLDQNRVCRSSYRNHLLPLGNKV